MRDMDRRRRAEARRTRAVLRRTTLAEMDGNAEVVAGPEAVSLAARLSRWSWSLTGRERPAYARSAIPCRFVPADRS
jgi:hypothetical protein